MLTKSFTSSDSSFTVGFTYTLITSPSCCNVSSNDFSSTSCVTVCDGSDVTGFETEGEVVVYGLVGEVGLAGEVVSPEVGVSPG